MVNSAKKGLDFSQLYQGFHLPISHTDCGSKCAPFNPLGRPFCCDPDYAVPVLYDQEWEYLQTASSQWQLYQAKSEAEKLKLTNEAPYYMVFASCRGHQACHRPTRAISCRQFPFFPYITEDGRFIGLSVEWEFEKICWLLNHLEEVNLAYREAFIQTYDLIFDAWMDDFESYATHSEQIREVFRHQRRRIPILHRNGKNYLLSPVSEKMTRVDAFPTIRLSLYTLEENLTKKDL